MKPMYWRHGLAAKIGTVPGLLLLLLMASSTAPAQPPAATEKEPTPPPREQTIYVPYDKLRDVFEKPGRGVFLSYEEFQRLWEAARAARQPAVEQKLPTPVVITESESEATVEKDVVRVKSQLKIDLLRAGWHEVPLRLAGAAILSATVNGQPAPITVDAQGQHSLLVQSDAKRPIEVRAELEYARAYTKAEGRHRVAFAAPQAAVNRWKIRIPQPGVEVEVRPLVAATVEEPAAGVAAKETRLMAFVGAAPQVEIQWTPKAEGASGLAAMIASQAEQEVNLETGVTRCQVRLTLTISRADVAKLTLTVPAGQKVVNVYDANVRKWSVAAAEAGQQRVNVELFEPKRGTQPLVVDLERFAQQPNEEISVPVVQVVDAPRQQGTVVVRVAPGLRAEATRFTGLSQIDAAELPPTLTRQRWDFSYRYAALPFDLNFRVEKVQPKLLVDELVEVFLDAERMAILHTAVIDVQQAGVFRVQTDVPAGFEVRQVRGVAVAGARAAAVDSHNVSGENNTRLTINFSSRAEGKVGIQVELVRRLEDANLAGPTGKQSTLPVSIPRVAPAAVEQVRGRIVVHSPESLQVNLGNVTGATSTPATDAYSIVSPPGGGTYRREAAPLALAYSKQPVALSLLAERKRPQVTITQLLVVRAKPGVISHEMTLNYDVKYSSVKSLRIDVPADLVSQLRNTTADVREQKIEPQPKDVAEKHVALSLTGPTEFFGRGAIKFVWEKKLDNLEIGKSADVEIPRIVPHGVDLATGQIVLAKEESIDVRPTDKLTDKPEGLEPIDPQHELMPGANVPDAASAFRFQDQWRLTIAATRYEPEELKHTSIEDARVQMVCTRSGTISVQARYKMRSARQRLRLLLPAGAEEKLDLARINGATAAIESGGKREHFIPLTGQTPDREFQLEIRYVDHGSAGQLELPEFPEEPAMQRVYLYVFLPEEQSLLGSRGPWTVALNAPSPDDLAARVPNSGNMGNDFPTDGKRYIFTAIGPQAGPDGALRLTTFDRRWLAGWIFGLVLIGGVIMLRRPLSQKILALALIAIALLICGVLLPTLTTELFRQHLDVALVLIVVLWGAWLVAGWVRALARFAPISTASAPAPVSTPPVVPPAPPPAAAESLPPNTPDAEGRQDG